MRNYKEAIIHSMKNPTEPVEFKYADTNSKHRAGLLLNGKFEGTFEYHRDGILLSCEVYNSKIRHSEHTMFRCDGSIENHYFRKNKSIHGEFKWFNEDGAVIEHKFYKSGSHAEELDYLLDTDRDAPFYFTLALYGIDKEYTFN